MMIMNMMNPAIMQQQQMQMQAMRRMAGFFPPGPLMPMGPMMMMGGGVPPGPLPPASGRLACPHLPA